MIKRNVKFEQQHVEAFISHILKMYAPFDLKSLRRSNINEHIWAQAQLDIDFYLETDPATKGASWYFLRSYRCYDTVLAYRVAHFLTLKATNVCEEVRQRLIVAARSIMEAQRVWSGIEIHPSAIIGAPFKIDHGTGTVIGETTEIGSFCCLLNNVTLGARNIVLNPEGKRHPTIGNDVVIAGNSRILGPITVGDSVRIGTDCVVTTDVPAGTQVNLISQIQHVKRNPSLFTL
jgi:serine O-acetyltransferase